MECPENRHLGNRKFAVLCFKVTVYGSKGVNAIDNKYTFMIYYRKVFEEMTVMHF